MKAAYKSVVSVVLLSLLVSLLPVSVARHVPVASAGGVSYIIVHAHNPEGVEIASIERSNSVQIYDDDTLIGYGAHDNETHNQPIAISSGAHTIKARFNGMTLSQNIDLPEGETKTITFVFTRTEIDSSEFFHGGVEFDHPSGLWFCWWYDTINIYSTAFSVWYFQLTDSNLGVWYDIGGIGYGHGVFNGIMPFLSSGVYQLGVYTYLEYHGASPQPYYVGFHFSSVPYDLLGTGVKDGEVPQLPVASFTYSPQNPVVGQEITFDASSSYDPDSQIIGYNWDFGDGNSAEGEVVTHAYAEAGDYSVSLTVTDNDGLSNSISKVVTVTSNQPPVASFSYSPEDPHVREEATFDASSSYDPDGGEIVSYNWDFGDGNIAEGELVTHAYAESGDYSVSLAVTDNGGVSNSISEMVTVTINQPPVASFTYYPKNLPSSEPMVGGITIFDASSSYDPDGQIVKYDWDFGDGETGSTGDSMYDHIFRVPRKHVVSLTVTDDDGLTNSESVEIDFTLANGDLLLCRSEGSWVPANFWSHVGIYDKASNSVIEARLVGGVGYYPLSDWFFPNQTCVRALRIDADQAVRDAAVAFASVQVGCQYDLFSILIPPLLGMKNADNSDGLGWYCSELVWGAYLWASNGLINLDMDAFAVGPDEIASSGWAQTVGEHREAVPDTVYQGGGILWGEARCSIDIMITDPDGLVLSKNLCAIPGAVYREVDVDQDGELDDAFMIPERKMGDYSIEVIPGPGALPSDTYSLEVGLGQTVIELARNRPISDTPTQGYIIRSTESGIMNYPPNQPSNVSPTDGATDVSLSPTLISSAFSDPDSGDTHSASQWQLTTTAGDYSSPVFDSGTDSTNLAEITIPSGILSPGVAYCWHVRYQDNHGDWSEWSAETSFTSGGHASASSLVSSPNPSTYGKSVTFRATVKCSSIPSPGIPTGTVEFWDRTTLLGSATLSRGTATLKVSLLGAGSHAITAIYNGDANFATSTSAALPQEVQKAKTSMRLTSSAGSSLHGEWVTFTATITSGAGIPPGTVQFMDNDTILSGPVALSSGTAAYSTSDLSVGVHAITAVYSVDDNFTSGSKTRWQLVKGTADPTMNKATTVSLASSPNPSTFGKLVTLRASVKSRVIPSPSKPTGTVEFWDGTALLGSATLNSSGTSTIKVSSLGAGTHTITAIYSGDANLFTGTSAALPQVVQEAKTSIGLTSSDGSAIQGQSVTFTATIKSTAGMPSGTVQFMDNNSSLGDPVALSSGAATYTSSDLSMGVHAITAVYSGDDNFTSSNKTRWQLVK